LPVYAATKSAKARGKATTLLSSQRAERYPIHRAG